MPHTQGLYYWLRYTWSSEKESKYVFMNHPKLTESNFMETSIGLKRVPLLQFTCVSDNLSVFANSVLSLPTRYWFLWNSRSKWYNCSGEKVVLARLGLSRSRALGNTSSLTVPLASESIPEVTCIHYCSAQRKRLEYISLIKLIKTCLKLRTNFLTGIRTYIR